MTPHQTQTFLDGSEAIKIDVLDLGTCRALPSSFDARVCFYTAHKAHDILGILLEIDPPEDAHHF